MRLSITATRTEVRKMESQAATPIQHVVKVDFPTVDEAIKTYVEKRDYLKLLHKQNELKEQELHDELDAIAMFLREKADALGVDSFKCASGTAYRGTKETYRIVNWDDFIRWIKETDNYQCLEKRVAKKAAREIHYANLAEQKKLTSELAQATDPHVIENIMSAINVSPLPKGLEYFSEVEFHVLRPRGNKEDE